jgi:ABC-2 type transport system permease protein
VPVETMPTWMHGFAEHQPATPVIETLRGLLMGTPIGNSVWLAIAWCAAITVVAVVAVGALYRHRTGT